VFIWHIIHSWIVRPIFDNCDDLIPNFPLVSGILLKLSYPTRLNTFVVSICDLGMPKKQLAKNATFGN
jgi:hypothetical protein